MMDNVSRRKQSIVAGGLTSSAGIFLSKVLGILYVVPFTAIAGEANLTYYARAYSIYDIVLNVTIAGIPYAIATMIAKYVVRDDYKTVILIRKLSTGILLVSGFLAMVTVFTFAGPIAEFTVKAAPGTEVYERTRIVFMIISASMFFAPFLSSFRGFHQGLKNLKSYAFSQVLEQFIRIIFLLGMGSLAVYIFHRDSIWAVYFAVGASSVGAIAAIIYFVFIDRRDYPIIKDKAQNQSSNPIKTKALLSELFAISVPYVIISFFGSNANIANFIFFNQAMLAHGETIEQTNLLFSLLSFTCLKLVSIPVVVSMGFSIAIIPYLTTAVEQRDFKLVRKYIEDALNSVLYIGTPLCFYLFALSEEIYYTMYGGANYVLGGYVLSLSSFLALFGTFNPVVSQLMMNLRLRKINIRNLLIGFAIALATIYPFTVWLGFPGVVLSSLTSSLFITITNLSAVYNVSKFNFRLMVKRLMVILMGIGTMQIAFMLLHLFGLEVVDPNRLISLFKLGIYGIMGLIAYVGMTGMFSLPQVLFSIDMNKLKAKVMRK